MMETVLDESTVRAVIEGRAQERGISWGAARLEAEKIFREIAANMNSTFLAVLNLIVNAIYRRIFASIEVTGIEQMRGQVSGVKPALTSLSAKWKTKFSSSIRVYSPRLRRLYARSRLRRVWSRWVRSA